MLDRCIFSPEMFKNVDESALDNQVFNVFADIDDCDTSSFRPYHVIGYDKCSEPGTIHFINASKVDENARSFRFIYLLYQDFSQFRYNFAHNFASRFQNYDVIFLTNCS